MGAVVVTVAFLVLALALAVTALRLRRSASRAAPPAARPAPALRSSPSIIAPHRPGPAERTVVVGDRVWWAAKRQGFVVTEVCPDSSFVAQGGPIIRNRKGREVPRWTLMSVQREATWRPDVGCWVVGQGPQPKVARGRIVGPDGKVLDGGVQVINPRPLSVSGHVKGTFAVGTDAGPAPGGPPLSPES